jgi:ATP-dependent Clp protease ATP-binding subunit ClpC
VFERFSNRARRVVGLAREEARRLGHPHIGTEHLLLGILIDGESRAAGTLAVAGASLETAREKVIEAVGRASGNGAAGAAAPAGDGGPKGGDLALTSRAKRALDRAGRFSTQRRDAHVDTDHVLLGILDVEGTAGQVLRRLGVDVARLRDAVDRTPVDRPAVTAPAEPTVEGASPRCPACGAALEATLAHRVLRASGATGQASDTTAFLVPYCSACGSALGAAPQ